jgi:hypothetical protein
MVATVVTGFSIWAAMVVRASSTVGVGLVPEPAMVKNGWDWVGYVIVAVVMSGSRYQDDMTKGSWGCNT